MSDDRLGLKHLGIIMDGNGRWAKKRNLPRTAGHLEGLKALKRVIIEAANQQIEWVTFYAFSTENWKRTEEEVSYLMRLFTSK
ncbi:MAG TPA: undecaprenyl diphosphate synthase family protein, partial [Sphaerochaeta sp.]|nr:undecaprenyl diphosphate synthase family protein [Sphaerochaeta sp.]